MYIKNPTSPRYRRILAALAAFLIFAAVSLPVAAALTPHKYNMSADYKSSVYYKNLTSLTLTGNGACDVLMVAFSQLGYHEGNGNDDFGGGNETGSKNFVEYNRLFGKLDNNEGNGMSYGYSWCASFINWCLRQAGVDPAVSGGEVSCTRWINEFFKPSGLWQDAASYGGSYKPRPGDLVFFRSSSSKAVSTHVGLVRAADDTYVYTIEGNTAERCVGLDTYALTDDYVIGYGTPRYRTDGDEIYDYSPSAEKRPGIYVVTATELNIRADATTASEILGQLKKSETVKVLAFSGNFALLRTENNSPAYASASYLQFVSGIPNPTYTVTFLDSDGKTVLSALTCKDGETPTPPEIEDFDRDGMRYAFSEWSPALAAASADATYTAVYTTAEIPTEASSEDSGEESAYDPTESDGDNETTAPESITPEQTDETDAIPPETDDKSTSKSGCTGTIGNAISLFALPFVLFAKTIMKKS